jgi:hypothetical protein
LVYLCPNEPLGFCGQSASKQVGILGSYLVVFSGGAIASWVIENILPKYNRKILVIELDESLNPWESV